MSLVQVVDKDHIAEILFRRPAALNTLNLEIASDLALAVDNVLSNPNIRVVIIAGEGRAFMAGGDLGYFHARPQAARPKASLELIGTLNTAILKLTGGPKLTIASINGAAAGAGMSLAMMADFAIAAETAKFNFSYTKVGASPDCGGSHALVRLVGLRRAMEIALLSETMDAATALRLGLVNGVVPPEALREETMRLAQRLAQGSPRSLAATKRLLRAAVDASLPEQLEAEMNSFAELSGSYDFDEALAAFFEKRAPVFTGD